MSSGRKWAKRNIVVGITAAVLGGGLFYATAAHHTTALPASAESLLNQADTLSWENRWADAQPLYAKAESSFGASHEPSKALYAKVSQEPPNESTSVQSKILSLSHDLQDPQQKTLRPNSES